MMVVGMKVAMVMVVAMMLVYKSLGLCIPL